MLPLGFKRLNRMRFAFKGLMMIMVVMIIVVTMMMMMMMMTTTTKFEIYMAVKSRVWFLGL
jgi:hypothetical protein